MISIALIYIFSLSRYNMTGTQGEDSKFREIRKEGETKIIGVVRLFRFKYHLALASDEKADNLNYRYARPRLLSLIALTREYRKMHKVK